MSNHPLDDGGSVPWIDGSLNPGTGRRIVDGSFPMSRGKGLRVLADGVEIAGSGNLARLTGRIPAR